MECPLHVAWVCQPVYFTDAQREGSRLRVTPPLQDRPGFEPVLLNT